MALTIPSRHRSIIGKLFLLPPEEHASILEALAAVAASPLSDERLAKGLSEATSLSRTDATEVVHLALSLHSLPFFGYVQADRLIPEFLSAIETDDALPGSGEQKALFGGFIKGLLDLQNIELASKGLHLLASHERLFCTAKIFSDLRPVFDDEIGKPLAFLTNHILRITVHRGLETEDIYIQMDYGELAELERAIQRARKKDEQLRRVVSETEIEFLAAEEKC